MLFLLGLQEKVDFAMGYKILSVLHQASKRPLKQGKKCTELSRLWCE